MDTHLAVSWLEQSGYIVAHNVTQLLPEMWIPSTKLYAEYRTYATEGDAVPLSIQKFSDFLGSRGARKDQKIRAIGEKSERSMFWLNIEIPLKSKDVQGGD